MVGRKFTVYDDNESEYPTSNPTAHDPVDGMEVKEESDSGPLDVDEAEDETGDVFEDAESVSSQSRRDALKTVRDTHYQSIGFVPTPHLFHDKQPEYWEHLDYIKVGAITKPQDGPNVKPSGTTKKHRCLTCIKQGSNCIGTSVVGGKCEKCRAMYSGSTARGRECLWMDPANNIWTYPDGQRAIGKFRKGNYKRRSDAVMEESEPVVEEEDDVLIKEEERLDIERLIGVRRPTPPIAVVYPAPQPLITHTDQIENVVQRGLLRDTARAVIEDSTATDDPAANLQVIFNSLVARHEIAGNLATVGERMEAVVAQLVVAQVLRRMLESQDGLSLDDTEKISLWDLE